jgi:hypothetical protein
MSNRISRPAPLLLVLVLAGSICGLARSAGAQETGKVILLGPELGRVIDSDERAELGLFPDVEGFVSAMFYQFADGSFAARVAYKRDGGAEITWRRDLPAEWIERLRGLVGGEEAFGPLETEDWGDTLAVIPAEPIKPPLEKPPKVRTRQLVSPGIVFGYYWPSLKSLGESLGADVDPGYGYGARFTVWTIPRVVFVADYFRWRSTISGVRELYRVDTRLTVQSVALTAQYKVVEPLFLGAGVGVYFCDYRCDYGEKHRRNEGIGAHVALGLLGGPHNETVNIALEARYVLATLGETSRGFPRTELSGPMVVASVLF